MRLGRASVGLAGLKSGVEALSRRVRVRKSGLASIVVRLPDGRVIAVEEYGDPTGSPVFYFHGWPASRLEAGLIPNLPVRLLALDRPGYGRSTPNPGRSLLDWPRDVAFVADRLGLQHFHVVGLSGGGPFAAACAYVLSDRVLGVALVSPVPPATPLAGGRGVGHLYRLGRHPRVAHRVFSIIRPLLRRRILTPGTVVGGGLPACDRAVLTRRMMVSLGLAWREGIGRSVQGALADALIYARPWGFDLGDIRVPMAVWSGGQDSLIPRAATAQFATIPGVDLQLLEDEGHYSLALIHAETILRRLVADRAIA